MRARLANRKGRFLLRVGLLAIALHLPPAGAQQATYEYDNVTGRLSRIIYHSDGTVLEYQYDGNGNRTQATLIADETSPTAPTGLVATVASQSRIDLSWTAATDNIAVKNYRIEQCEGTGCSAFQMVATIVTTNYSNTGLTAGTTYVYRVQAQDAAGHQSAWATVSATTPANSAPTAPGTPTFTAITMTSATANWTSASDDIAVTGYQYRLDAGNWQSLGNQNSIALTNLQAFTTYTFQVRAFDASNNVGAVASATFRTLDTQAPTAPGTPSFTNITGSSATATWIEANDNVGVTGCQYRLNGGSWVSSGDVRTLGLIGLASGTAYTFSVRAQDESNNFGPASSGNFTTTDSIAPSTPMNLSGSAPASGTVNLSWAASNDNVGVTAYKIYRNSVNIGSSGSTSYTDSTTSGSTTYAYRVSARDGAGNESPQSSPINVTTPDTIAPSAPNGLSATALNGTQVALAWNASSDSGGSGLAGYRIHRNGTHIGTVTSTNYSDATVSPGGSYAYTVAAYDNAGNISGASNTASVTTPNVPTTPGLTLQPGSDISRFTAVWTVPTGSVSYYHLEVNANYQGPVTETYYPPQTSKSFAAGSQTDWELRIRACNAANQCSAWSLPEQYQTCPRTGCP